MTMPTPPAPTPAPGPEPTGQPPAPAGPPAPVNAPPAAPPVPTPPTWTPPQPPQADDGEDDLDKLPQKWQKKFREKNEEAAKYRVRARTETVIRHAYTTAVQHGVNPDALLGSVAFTTAAANLDPSSPEFPAKLAEAILAAKTANPWMAAQAGAPAPPTVPQPPPVSGGDFAGTSNAGSPTRPTSLREAFARQQT